MIPVTFEQSNCKFTPPPELVESQCMTINAYRGTVNGGNLDGSMVVVVAWKPSQQEIDDIVSGKPVLLSCIGGLPPHMIVTDFETAIHPQ